MARFALLTRGPQLFLALALVAALAACTEKARGIQAGAAKFEVDSLAAIDGIDRLRKREVAPQELTAQQRTDFFVNGVLNSQGGIGLDELEILHDPITRELPRSEAQWAAFLGELRRQYRAFAGIFRNLEGGSVLAADEVESAVPVLDKLVAQMTALGGSIAENPPLFIGERAALAAALEDIRDDRGLSRSAKVKLLTSLQGELDALVAAEREMARQVAQECAIAAQTGLDLRQLLIDYDQLTSDDIIEGVTVAIRTAAGISGRDLSGLQSKFDELRGRIEGNPNLSGALDEALKRISALRAA